MSSQRVRLNDNQIRHILATMARVESVLAAIERLLELPEAPFTREQNDLSERERESMRAIVGRLRGSMEDALSRLQIPPMRKDMSARWSIEAALRAVDVAFSDLGGVRLEGYGDLDDDAAELVLTLSRELREITEQGILMLRHRP